MSEGLRSQPEELPIVYCFPLVWFTEVFQAPITVPAGPERGSADANWLSALRTA